MALLIPRAPIHSLDRSPLASVSAPITEPKLLLHKELTVSALPYPVDCVSLRSDLPSQPHSVTPLVPALFPHAPLSPAPLDSHGVFSPPSFLSPSSAPLDLSTS